MSGLLFKRPAKTDNAPCDSLYELHAIRSTCLSLRTVFAELTGCDNPLPPRPSLHSPDRACMLYHSRCPKASTIRQPTRSRTMNRPRTWRGVRAVGRCKLDPKLESALLSTLEI